MLIYEHRCASCNTGSKYVRDAINTNFGNNTNIKVIYLDNGGATCQQVQSWIDQGSLLNAPIIPYSNDYSSPYGTGMPVIVIAGGASHKKYLQANGYNKTSVDGITSALSLAIADLPADVINADQTNIKISLFNGTIFISNISDQNISSVALYDIRGDIVRDIMLTDVSNELQIPVTGLTTGSYVLKLRSGDMQIIRKIIIE